MSISTYFFGSFLRRVATLERVRHRLGETNLESALSRQVQPQRTPRRLDGEPEAHLMAIT